MSSRVCAAWLFLVVSSASLWAEESLPPPREVKLRELLLKYESVTQRLQTKLSAQQSELLQLEKKARLSKDQYAELLRESQQLNTSLDGFSHEMEQLLAMQNTLHISIESWEKRFAEYRRKEKRRQWSYLLGGGGILVTILTISIISMAR